MVTDHARRARHDPVSEAGVMAGSESWSNFFSSPRGRGLRAFRAQPFRVMWMTLFVGQLGFWISDLDADADGASHE